MSKRRAAGVLAVVVLGCNGRPELGSARDEQVASVRQRATVAKVWDEQERLTPADQLSGDYFGCSLAFEGTRAVVGACDALLVGVRQDAGAVFVEERNGETWSQQKLVLDDASTNGFGYAVGLSGETLIATTVNWGDNLGKALVYVHSGNTWSPQAELVPPVAYVGLDEFGVAVALAGDTALVGAHGKDGWAGAAYVFERKGATWGAGTRLVPDDAAAYDYFGYALALSGDTALIGAYGKDVAQGAAYVFVRDGAGWKQQAKLVAPDPENLDQFGNAVAIDGDTALVGANFKATEAGAVYAYVRSGTSWGAPQKLVASDGAAHDRFGSAVAVKGDVALVGAKHQDALDGGAYFFKRNGSTWSEQQKIVKATSIDPSYAFGLGQAVGIDGDYGLVGAPNSFASTGAVYAFRYALAQGSDCDAGTACHSGHCTDGVCCDSACQNECSACVQSLTGKPDGECQPIPAGTDPELECETDAGYPNNCGADGLCAGDGHCRTHAVAGIACEAVECTAGNALNPQCNDAGKCADNAQPCAPYVCASTTACGSHCAGENDCDQKSYCDGGSCVPVRTQGAACDDANQCASGFCTDGVCCDTACDGQCEACAEPNELGTCQAVSGAPRGGRQACKIGSAECAGACDGTTRDACRYADATSACGKGCAAGVATTGSCDGEGSCAEDPQVECGGYACNGDACRTSCLTDKHCATGYACDGRRCVKAGSPAPGGCETDADCATGEACDAATQLCKTAPGASKQDSGCGCRLASTPRAPHLAATWLALAALVISRRHTKRRRHGNTD